MIDYFIYLRFPPQDPDEQKVPRRYRRKCHHQNAVLASVNFNCFVKSRDQVDTLLNRKKLPYKLTIIYIL